MKIEYKGRKIEEAEMLREQANDKKEEAREYRRIAEVLIDADYWKGAPARMIAKAETLEQWGRVLDDAAAKLEPAPAVSLDLARRIFDYLDKQAEPNAIALARDLWDSYGSKKHAEGVCRVCGVPVGEGFTCCGTVCLRRESKENAARTAARVGI